MADKKNTVGLVWEIAEPIAKELGLTLWDVRFQKEGANWFLRIFIDKPGGINIDDCVNMSHAIDGPLDELDPIEQSYSLQVSSPGIERELIRDFHFEQFLGENVTVRFIHAYEGKRDYKGVLVGYDNGNVTVELEDGRGLSFNKKEASFVKLDDFGGFNENE